MTVPRQGVTRPSLARPMSTRRLILAALVCGVAILVAFAVQVTVIAR